MKSKLLLTGCMLSITFSQNLMAANEPGNEDKKPGNSNACVVYKKDGTAECYQKLELVTGIFKAPHLLADGKIRIKAEDITAYQTAEVFAVSQDVIGEERKSKIAKEVLPGFATRIVKGNINVYVVQVFNGAKSIDVFYIQQEGGKIELFNREALLQMVQAEPYAVEYLNTNKKLSDANLVKAVAEAYNNAQTITRN